MKKLEKGFTLIELMIVVAIIAILAAVAAPRFGQQIKKAADAKAVQIVGSWRSGLNIHYSDNYEYAQLFTTLQTYVDKGTSGKTYTSNTDKSFPAAKLAVTDAGTTSYTGNKHAQFEITGTSTSAAIEFTATNGVNTNNISWAAF